MDAGGAHLLRRDTRDVLDELRVAGGAQADVVREDDRADHVVVAVHGVHAVEDRHAQPGLERVLLEAVVHVRPVLEAIGLGIRVAAGQDRAQEVLFDVALGQLVLLGLGHLADLLVERHLREQRLDLGSWTTAASCALRAARTDTPAIVAATAATAADFFISLLCR